MAFKRAVNSAVKRLDNLLSKVCTIDATATLADIALGKTAYVKGKRITGTNPGGTSAEAGYFINQDGVVKFHNINNTLLPVSDINIVNTGVALPAYTAGGSTMSFYKCASLSDDVLIITGSNEAVNGTWTKTDPSATGYSRRWIKNGVIQDFIHWGDQNWQLNVGNSTRFQGNKAANPWEGVWVEYGGHGWAIPTITPQTTTWTGYKAVWNNSGYYDYESRLTGDTLVFSSFTPVVGKSYTADGKIRGIIPISPLINSIVLTSSNHPEYEGTYCLIDTTAEGYSRVWKQQNVNHFIWGSADDPYMIMWYISDSPCSGSTFTLNGVDEPVSSDWMDSEWESAGITTAWNT